MTRYILRRLLLLVPVLLGISIITFGMLRLIPGDPAMVMMGEHASPDQVEAFRERMGLNEPIYVQYLRYMRDLVQMDLGRSILTNRPVIEEIGRRFPATFELTLGAMAFATFFGVTAGIIAAYNHNSFVDVFIMFISLVGVSMPIFWLGLMLAYLFGFKLRWLPPSGRLTVGVELLPLIEAWRLEGALRGRETLRGLLDFLSGFYVLDALLTGNWAALWDVIKHLILPSVALGSIPMAIIARMTRSSLLETLGEDYIRTARSKGLFEWAVLFSHALRNALLPIVTVVGLQLGLLLGGAILTETIFSWPGLGRLVVNRILARDYPAVQGSVIVIASTFVLINLIVDISYAYLDPRIHYN
ncbi:MAG: ABC transporter permease [Chloroflexota bacterium]|nr:ABC transporter permease [Chloroflexota bacterium]